MISTEGATSPTRCDRTESTSVTIGRFSKTFLFFLSLFTSLFAVGAGLNLKAPVESLDSTTFPKAELAQIQKALGISLGSPLDEQRIDDGIHALYHEGRYQSLFVEVEASNRGLRVSIHGSRVRKLHHITYHGVDPDLLEEAKANLNLQEGGYADLRTFSYLRERLKAACEARGYYFADVQVIINDLPGGSEADVEVDVKKGKPTRVGKITVGGVSAKIAETLVDRLTLRSGDRFTKVALDESVDRINKYFQDNQYPTSKVAETALNFSEDKLTVNVTFTVQMGQRYQFEFVGNTVFDEGELRALMTPDLMSQTDSTERLSELIEKKYQELGFYFAKVRTENVHSAGGRLNRVRFLIHEGSRVIIDSVQFNGAGEIPADELESLYFGGAPGVLGRHLYWEGGLEEANRNFIVKLHSMGYLNALITGPRPIFTEDQRGVTLVFDLEPGTQTRVGLVRISGVNSFPIDQITALMPLSPGMPLDRDQIAVGKSAILSFYQNEGFADVKFIEPAGDNEILFSSDRKQATIDLKLDEGRRYFVGKIAIVGNRRTKDKVILREMTLETGDKFSPAEIHKSEENIGLLNLFSHVEIDSTTNPVDPSRKDLRIVVNETKPGFGEGGLGVAYEDPRFRVRGFLGLGYRNVLGLNNTITSRGEIAVPLSQRNQLIPFIEYAALLGYRAPYPFDWPFTFSSQAGLDASEIYLSDDLNRSQVEYRARIEERLEKKLSSKVTLLYRLHSYERDTVSSLRLGGPPVAGFTEGDVRTVIGSTGPGLIVDLRDDLFNPTKGSYHTLDVEYAHPYLLSDSNVSFVMTTSRNSFYFPLPDPFSFSMFIGGAYARSLFRSPLPEARLINDLSLGGQNSVRGFTLNQVGPPTSTTDAAYYNCRFELTAALVSNISAALFYDTGQIFYATTLQSWQEMDRLDGVGIGLRYRTSVGPVVLDVAHGLGPWADQSLKFSFSVGVFQ